MTLAIQVSVKLSNGTIYVLGGESPDQFYANALTLFDSDTNAVDELLANMKLSFLPTAAGSQAVANLQGGGLVSHGQQFYTPPGPQGPGNVAQLGSQPRVAQVPVTVSAPYQERVAFKAAIDAAKAKDKPPWPKFNGDAKNWTLPPGIDLSPFAKWLPPGV